MALSIYFLLVVAVVYVEPSTSLKCSTEVNIRFKAESFSIFQTTGLYIMNNDSHESFERHSVTQKR